MNINKDIRLIKLKEIIHSVAREEDLVLRRLSENGIMTMPELAFVHQVAKKLLNHSQELLGVPTFHWATNKGIGSGLTDLVIEPGHGDKSIAIEFKVGGSGANYVKDINKLQKLDRDIYDRVFCALMDVFVNDIETHSRIKSVEEIPGVLRIGDYLDFFSTLTDYKSQVCCIIGIWVVS